MERTCRYVPLSKQPLVLVLCQVKFSPVRRMADYIPAIQEEFRRHWYPLEKAGKIQQLTVTPTGLQTTEQERWEYRTKDEQWSILVMQDAVVLQTTAYRKFEDYAKQLELAVGTVLRITEHEELGLLQRIGLRYIDLIRPREGEDFRYYLRPGLHGVQDDVFNPGTHRIHIESAGSTKVGDEDGMMVVRIVQNSEGFDLPPDLLGGAPKFAARAKAGELATLVDMDHFLSGKFDPGVEWIIETAYRLHDHLVETFHEHVITPEAVEVWK
ncbi:TIGR04255 family protein [Myxococcota bacterium]